jgi:hypothetical protein
MDMFSTVLSLVENRHNKVALKEQAVNMIPAIAMEMLERSGYGLAVEPMTVIQQKLSETQSPTAVLRDSQFRDACTNLIVPKKAQHGYDSVVMRCPACNTLYSRSLYLDKTGNQT